MALMVLASALFFLTVAWIFARGALKVKGGSAAAGFLPKSRTEMIKGIAAIGIVFSHIATYSKGAAGSGLLRYYNVFCTTLGGVGVNLFFFISGYGNFYSVARAESRVKWLWKRCATLVIVYLCCFLVVLGILYAGGYRTTPREILDNLLHLRIPYSTVWYVKIQLLAYAFMTVASMVRDRKYRVLLLAALCVASSIVLHRMGYDDRWWKSTACFAVGASTAAYKDEIVRLMEQRKKSMTIFCIAMLPFAFVAAVLVEAFPVKLVGNVVLCAGMMYLFERAGTDSAIYVKLGAYSLELYLVHRSFVAWLLDDGRTTNWKVALIFGVSLVFTLVAKWVGDRLTGLCFKKRS